MYTPVLRSLAQDSSTRSLVTLHSRWVRSTATDTAFIPPYVCGHVGHLVVCSVWFSFGFPTQCTHRPLVSVLASLESPIFHCLNILVSVLLYQHQLFQYPTPYPTLPSPSQNLQCSRTSFAPAFSSHLHYPSIHPTRAPCPTALLTTPPSDPHAPSVSPIGTLTPSLARGVVIFPTIEDPERK